jgi:hypothetical protein
MGPPRGVSFWERQAPMGPREHPIIDPQNQAKGIGPPIKRHARRPRARTCLLKDCGRVFRPDHPQARYCSEHCRNEAAKWRDWKARRKYRKTDRGKQVRRVQSRRYRVRQKERMQQKHGSAGDARVITRSFFFVLLRSPWLIRRIPPQAAVASAALLLLCLSPGSRTSPGSRETLVGASPQSSMNSSRSGPDILIRPT